MVNIWLRTAAFATCLTASSAFGDFLPPNDLYLEDNVNFSAGLTEAQFNQVIDQVESVYAPIVKSLGGKLIVKRLWTDSTVNASANQQGKNWYVNMYGGLARRGEVTMDGFAMVLCHEIGHHIGGFPYSSWAANEGQSDYFASLSCARMIWGNEKDLNAKAADAVTQIPKDRCDSMYADSDRQNLCYRQMLSNESIAGLLAALNNGTVSYETPDKSVVRRTYDAHPAAQCRFDTYMAATLCTAKWDNGVIPKTEAKSADYTCTARDGYKIGLRPTCWFKPTL
jgi:hypothetical protein